LFGEVAAYVMQDDELFETMTPYECLKLFANLRLSGTSEEKEKRVMKVIEDMKLTNYMNTSVSRKCAKEGDTRR
jgi:ABC-type multidrug transport system ATPase subunit